jgi:Zn-dependent M28 family amino/carboxypeptidase
LLKLSRILAAPLLLALAACATPLGQPRPPTASPQQLHDRVGAFVQPTQDGRLAALKAQLDAAGLPYAVEEFEGRRPGPAKGYNVVVRVGPETGPKSSKEILLAAHYDAVVFADGKLADGAVDNAASVVAMIEATRRVAGQTKHPVRLFLTDQEELGLVGAQAWVKAHGVDNLAAVINADINANGETLMYGLNNGPQSAFLVEAVRELCDARAMSCLDFPEYPPSDDRAFSAAGAPTISLGHQPKAEAEKLRAFMLNPPTSAPDPSTIPAVLALIHTPNDKIDRVEPATLAQAADFFTALVMKLDAELN